MDIEWSHLLWQGRWDGLVMLWQAIIADVQTFWWFGPFLVVLIVAAGRKGLVRLIAYVAKVFVHTHGPS